MTQLITLASGYIKACKKDGTHLSVDDAMRMVSSLRINCHPAHKDRVRAALIALFPDHE